MIEKLKELQTQLSAKFDVADVKQRDAGFGGKKLDYISIDSVINRLNEVLPLGYSWRVEDVKLTDTSVIVIGTLTITREDGLVIERSGVGADVLGKDIDKAIKTAFAEAFKKASNTLGVGLYLWDADERADIAKERAKEQLNNTVKDKRQFTPTQLEKNKLIKKHFKITTDDEFNVFLKGQYPNDKVNTKKDLTPENIDEYIKWAYSKMENK